MSNNQQPIQRKNWGKTIMRLIILIMLLYVIVVAILVLFENKLVYPDPGMKGEWQPTDIDFEEVTFQSADDTSICGWFLPAPATVKTPETVLLCHGNGENAAMSTAHMGDKLRHLLGANVLVFDYRGYGKSDGFSHEVGILKDTEAAMAWLNQRTGTTPNDVIVAGHSIGGGPACHIASKAGAKAIVLQRTFASLTDAAKSNFWFMPVEQLMSNRYPSAEKIKSCDRPLFQSHGDRDYLVPIKSGRKLFEASPASNKTFYINRNKGHWDPLPDQYWDQLKRFVMNLNEPETTKDVPQTGDDSASPDPLN